MSFWLFLEILIVNMPVAVNDEILRETLVLIFT